MKANDSIHRTCTPHTVRVVFSEFDGFRGCWEDQMKGKESGLDLTWSKRVGGCPLRISHPSPVCTEKLL